MSEAELGSSTQTQSHKRWIAPTLRTSSSIGIKPLWRLKPLEKADGTYYISMQRYYFEWIVPEELVLLCLPFRTEHKNLRGGSSQAYFSDIWYIENCVT